MIYLLIGMKREKVTSVVGRPRAFDTEEALDRAMQVFGGRVTLAHRFPISQMRWASIVPVFTPLLATRNLFRKVLDRYLKGPSVYLSEALREPTARRSRAGVLWGRGSVDRSAYAENLYVVQGALSCGDDPLRKEFAAQRVAGFEGLRARFRRAVSEGDLPINSDVDTLANFVQTANFGLTVQASTGATRKDLLCVVAAALQAWPK